MPSTVTAGSVKLRFAQVTDFAWSFAHGFCCHSLAPGFGGFILKTLGLLAFF